MTYKMVLSRLKFHENSLATFFKSPGLMLIHKAKAILCFAFSQRPKCHEFESISV